MSWVNVLVSAVLGVAGGWLGGYLMWRSTDERRRKEDDLARRKQLREVERQMPDLFSQIRGDLASEHHKLTRNVMFERSPGEGASCYPHIKYFHYSVEHHDDLAGKITVLENHGYIKRRDGGQGITFGDKCVFTEGFVSLIRETG